VKRERSRKSGPATRVDYRKLPLIPALVAAGGGFAALPAVALELGDVRVESSLGQPLRASIAYALAPNEALASTCVSLQPTSAGDSLPTISRATVSVAEGLISITGDAVVREPLMSMRLNVRCPYTVQLSRDYMLFFDPAQPATTVRTALAPSAAENAVTQPVIRPARATPAAPGARRQQNLAPIAGSGRYRVQPGDSLSLIVQRIENRQVGLWEAVGTILEANPGAFIDGNPNRLKAGAWLVIPDFADGRGSPDGQENAFPAPGAEVTVATAMESQPVAPPADAATPEATPEIPAAIPEPSITAPAAAPEPPADGPSPLAEIRPQYVTTDTDNPYVVSAAEDVVIPDTQVEASVARLTSPNNRVAAVGSSESEPESSKLLWWLTGIGLTLIGGLLYLSSAVRRRFGSTPIAPAAMPQKRRTDGKTVRTEAAEDMHIALEDDSPTQENLALDADLFMGTGLSEGTDVEVIQDFGFAQTTALDMELPEEMSSEACEAWETDMIPPLNMESESILESEILPGDYDDEYDMSVIMDATKMPQPEDVTERDLGAIELGTTEEPLLEEDYTLNQETDFAILVQDYEDELTATQALNQEIAKAATELAERMDGDEAGEETSEISLASMAALDITAHLPATNDDSSDLETTGVTAEMPLCLEADGKTADGDQTAEMPVHKRGSK